MKGRTWAYGVDVVIDEETGELRPADPNGGEVHLEIGEVNHFDDVNNEVTLNISQMKSVTFKVPVKKNGIEAMKEAITQTVSFDITYSHGRVPPECWICGLLPAAEGRDEKHWFREFWHHRHQTHMPVCEACTTEDMKLR
jgi:hypothetical protein